MSDLGLTEIDPVECEISSAPTVMMKCAPVSTAVGTDNLSRSGAREDAKM